MTKHELLQKKTQLVAQMKDLVALASKENRDLNEVEQQQYDAAKAEIKKLDNQIKLLDEIEGLENEQVPAVVEDEVKLHAEAKGSKTNGVKEMTKKAFGSVGGYFQAVHKSKMDTDCAEKLLKFQTEVAKVTMAAGMNESLPSDGGVLVGTDVSTVLLEKAYETGKLVSRAFKIPLSQKSNSIDLPTIDETSRINGSRYGGIQMYWEGEAAKMTATKPKLGKLGLKLKNLNGLVYVTEDLLDDAAALEAWIMKKFPEEAGFKLDDAILNGTGAGMPLGINKSGALVIIDKEVGQAAKTILAENIIKMWARYNGSEENAVWVVNRDTLPQVTTLKIIIGTSGQLIYMPPTGLSGRQYGTILGAPVIPMEQCETLGTQGDIMLIDMGQYIMADKGALKVASSMHVRFEYNEMAYRFTYRADGQPERSSVLTPFKGTATVSPYVTIAVRS